MKAPRHSRSFLLALAITLALIAAGCPDDPAPTCQDTICSPGESRCEGNYQAVCASDGKSWEFNSCGTGMYCAAGGACQSRACTNLGGGGCLDTATLSLCADNGQAKSTESCGGSEICAGGACVPASCTDGATRCGDAYQVLTCTGGAWVSETCTSGQVCVQSGGAAACEARNCEPQTASCDGNTSVVCSFDGRSETRTACGSGEVCQDGFCVGKVCGVDYDPKDVTGDSTEDGTGDAGPDDVEDEEVYIPPLEPIPTMTFTLGGQAKDFEYNLRADYIAADKNLKISGGGNLGQKIEINIAPLEPFTVGQWNESDGSEVGVVICYFDGTHDAEVAPCTVGFSHASIAYMVDLQKNNGLGTYLEGTFAGTLKGYDGSNLELTGGEFLVQQK